MIILTIIFIIFDIISKILVINNLELYESIKIINNFLSITYVNNTGAAWSLFNDKSFIVLIISFIMIGGIIYYIIKNNPQDIADKISYAMILGGALGNFIDRMIYGYVIDFIDIKIFNYNYPIFNLADMFIVIGFIILIIKAWRNSHGSSRVRR